MQGSECAHQQKLNNQSAKGRNIFLVKYPIKKLPQIKGERLL